MEGLKKIVRPILWAMFAIYGLVVIYVCFFSREPKLEYPIAEYFKINSNIVPFKTIVNYIRLSFGGYVTLAWTNVFGNFILILPLGMLLPCLIKWVNRFWKISLIGLLTVICIEGLQCIFRVGIIDIDDLILNLSGIMLGYALIKIPIFYKALCKIGAIENGEEFENEKS